jgi:subtilisin family serine protease
MKKLRLLLFVSFSLFVSTLVKGQSSPFLNTSSSINHSQKVRPNELLVSFKPGVNADKLLALYPELAQQYGLSVVRPVAHTMNVWLIGHTVLLPQEEILMALYRLPEVEIVQHNHVIQKRTNTKQPNDTYYSLQWQYANSGGNGGVVGADISAELAWYITTGGVTPNGDTIVVAIIDDGMDTTIPDMVSNWWKNKLEVPNNSIDDDGNGYIDDYRGWNSYSGNDKMFNTLSWEAGGWHGSSVAGIVGAKGDDNYGVSGVNWNVKLMIIAGGGDEAEALAAYEYALDNRKLYDATGGAKGAYVIATNASWGVDQLLYTDAPLWCSFYDSLGKAGILNAGATANENWDIEVTGDMPTSCPSDYLIAVTNTKRDDVKETYAGYGTVSIDLGAPGEDAYTVDAYSDFDAFGGTSGATPHVTGAIALLFSVPNQEFADYATMYPDSAALWAKRFILEGVDSNASLTNITVTGGRLNLFGAIEKMYEYFPDEPIDTTPTTSVLSIASFDLQVYPNPAVDEIVLQLPNADNALVKVLSLEGKLIMEVAAQGESRFHHVSINNLAAGIYVLEVRNSQGARAYHKLIKQ